MNLFVIFAMSMSIQNTNLLSAICWIESRHVNVYTADDVGSASYGPCQIKLGTANWMHLRHVLEGPYLVHSDLLQQEVAVYYSAMYIKYQLERYPNDLRCAISAYNGGRCLKSNQKTYVDKVLRRLAILDERSHGKTLNPSYNPSVTSLIYRPVEIRPVPVKPIFIRNPAKWR